MKKLIFLSVFILLFFISSFSVGAEGAISNSNQIDTLYEGLSDEAKASLERIGVSATENTLDGVSPGSMFSEILRIFVSQTSSVMTSFSLILAVMLLFCIVEGLTDCISQNSVKEVISVVTALSVACILILPVKELIDTANEIIFASSNLMLLFIPAMLAVLVSCGQGVSGAGYYSLMTVAAQFVSRLASDFISPMLSVFLGVSICSSIVPGLRFQGLLSTFSKTLKWILSFSFTIFSALLTFKTLIATSVDNVSTKAVRYTMSSFVPVIGSALSEAYKTVQGSVGILKSGMGVFVIFAVIVIFLPIILKLLMWLFSVNILKSIGEIINLSVPCSLLSGVSTVLSVLLSVILCIAALFIVSTALIISVGGRG